MYGQGNYPPPRFRSSFHQSNLPPPPPPISYNPPPPHPLTHQAPSGPPPSHYQHNALQPSPSYLPIQGSSPMPPPYSHVSQPMPPPPVFRLPPPHPQGQLLYQNPPPLPPMTQLLPAPPPPQLSGFYTSYGQSTAGDAFPPPPPPPPRPASPPPLPPSSPPPTAPIPTTQDMSENMAHMVEGEASGALSLPPQPPKPANEEVVHNINVLCKFMVKIGPDFENMARTKEAGNPNFAFLFGGEPGNDAAIGYEYFQWMKRKCLLEKDFLQDQVQNDSSTVSDMDMEDDISQPDTDRGIDESVKESTDKATSLGISPAPSMTGQIRAEVAVSTINPLRVLHGGEDDKDSSFTEDVSRVRGSPDAVEHALENNVQGSMRTSMKYSSMIEVSSTFTEAGTAEAPTVHVKHVSPFRLIQGYASDDSEEDDKEKNDEGINSDRISLADMHEHTKFKSTSSYRSTQEVSRMAKEDESLDNLTKKGLDLQDDNCDVQKNDLLGSDNLNLKNQIGKHWLADDAKESVKLDVDEFGRLVRHGASDSDSDEMHVSGRRIKRGRNRSRSRSPPQGSRRRRRSRSPRRRDKRSRSRSWSPKRTTSKSPPVFRRTNVSSRRDRDQPSECFDFNRGRCFRGASCRFLHRDSTRHTSRQHEYSDSARDSVVDRHGASPTFVPGSDAHHKDPKSTEVHAGERINRDVSSSKADNTEPTGRDDIREVQVPNQIVQGVPHMEESEAGDVSEAPDNLNEGKHTEVLLKSSLSHEAEIVVTHVSSGGGTQLSQITQSANISESQGLQGQSQHSHEELAAHPTPSLQVKTTSFHNLPPSTHPYLGQTYSDQGLISHPYPNYIPSYPNPSLPPKEFPPPRFLGPNANFQPPQKFPPGPPGPLPIHFPSDKLITQFGSENQNFCPSHRMHITSDYNSQSALPRNVGWSNIPPPPPLHSVPPKHEFNPMIRPHFHRDEFNRRPLLPNPQDYPFTRDQFAYPPIPEGSQTLSDYQKDYQLHKQSFHPRELSAPAIKDLPFSDHPPPYGEQLPTNSNYTRASMGPSLQHPPSFMDSSKPPLFNPFASRFEQAPTDTELVSSVSGRENDGYHSIKYNQITPGNVPLGGPNLRLRASPSNLKRHADAYDPLFDSIEPNSIAASKIDSLHKSSNFENSKQKQSAGGHNKLEVDEFGEVATDAEAGAVENVSPNPVDEKDWSPGLPLDAGNAEGGEIEIDQGLPHEKSKKCKDSRSMKLFKTAIAEFVKEVLKPSWRQGNMSKEAFKTIVKKTVDKVSGAMKSHQIPRSQAKINQYVESSERKLTKLVMGYVDKYVKV